MKTLLAVYALLPWGSGAAQTEVDPRTLYDVEAYRIDLGVDPERESISGFVAVEAVVVGPSLGELTLDMHASLTAREVRLVEGPLDPSLPLPARTLHHRREGNLLHCVLPAPRERGERVTVQVLYEGSPKARNAFDGMHWRKTPDGRPWIGTSCQILGAHTWWPCKASFFHPADKPERVFFNATVPAGLIAVSNGRLTSREPAAGGRETFRWRLDYPCETYAVTLNVAPYEVLEGELTLRDVDRPVPYAWYVLPGHKARAEVQFAEVPRVLDVFARAFGPWPFPDAKVSLVETSFWGMEHTTAVAYGSSFPAWLELKGEPDPYGARNQWFDFILVHELAHEWWGNAVSAADWGDFWIHEGFATYAGGVFVELTQGREAADRFFTEVQRRVHPKSRLHRGDGKTAREAYSSSIYNKGGAVLHTLRHYLDDDEAWWTLLREFHAAHRYGNATTADFRAALERLTERDWGRFFAEWVYGVGYPRLSGRVRARSDRVLVEVSNEAADTTFHVPLDLRWTEGGAAREERVWLGPGHNRLELECSSAPTGLQVLHLQRLLGKHDVRAK